MQKRRKDGKPERRGLDRRRFVSAVAGAALAGPAVLTAGFKGSWSREDDRSWLGPEYWANPLQDWRVRGGHIECHLPGGDRNVFLLTREVSTASGDLRMSVRMGRLEEDRGPLGEGFAGFRFGIRGRFDDYRDSAVRGFGINAGMASDGRLFIGELTESSVRLPGPPRELELRLHAAAAGSHYRVTLEARSPDGRLLEQVERTGMPGESLTGGLALVCSSGPVTPTPMEFPPMEANGGSKPGTQRGGTLRFWFRDWEVAGSKVTAHPERAFGPILFAMHTLSWRVLKMTVQMAPVADGAEPVSLQVGDGTGGWRTIGESPIHADARTAHFRITGWDDRRDVPYRLVYRWSSTAGQPDEYSFTGTVRKDPREKPRILIGALTCNNDFGFPHSDVIRALENLNPDLLLFTGDQIYERVCEYGIQREPVGQAMLDYLRKWYLFGWSYAGVVKEIPTITIPDDHDVYHGNVWGAAGQPTDRPDDELLEVYAVQGAGAFNKAEQDSGGYKLPARWVNMVQRTQTSHLPDPFDPAPVKQGITVYYTSMVYGGVSLAILEDRKWKSSARQMIPWANIQNGWAQNPEYDAARDGDVEGTELLGQRQIEFLETWAEDWSDGTFIKMVVSQTLFANLATLPPPANNDDVTPGLPVLPIGEYAKGEVLVADHDSNGWPQTPRNVALRAMRKACAFQVGGDQHLGSLVQYGIDDSNDGPWALCTPAISNLWPRRWYPPKPGRNRKPGSPAYTGEFLDGFGNRMTVHAVANPARFGVEPAILYDRAPGYGTIEIDRTTRRITLANWPRWVDATEPGAKPFEGWPRTIHQLDNGIAGSSWVLEAVEAPGLEQPVIQVVEESSGEVVYTVRAEGSRFTPRVFRPGSYTVKIFDPDGAGDPLVRRALQARRA